MQMLPFMFGLFIGNLAFHAVKGYSQGDLSGGLVEGFWVGLIAALIFPCLYLPLMWLMGR